MLTEEIEILGHLSAPDQAAWDRLADDRSFYLGTRWLAFQQSQEHEGDLQFVCVRSGGRLVAGVAVFIVGEPSSKHYDPRRLFPDVVSNARITLVGGTRGFLSGPLGDGASTLGLLLQGIQTIADTHSEGVAWWLYTSSEDAAAITAESRVVPRMLNAECVIELSGEGFGDYLASLPGKRREQVRYDLRAFERAELSIEETLLSKSLEECGLLLAQTQQKYGLSTSAADMTEWLSDLNLASADSGRVYLCRSVAGEPIGFSLVYSQGNSDYVRAVGFDYQRAPHVGEYFVLLCYEPLRAAYKRGATTLHLGSGAYRSKARRGASIRPLWAVPSNNRGWDPALSLNHNILRASELADEIPGDALVMSGATRIWL